MKNFFNFLARRKSPEAGGVTPPAELDVERWVKELDARGQSGQPTTGLGNPKLIGMEFREMHTGDQDLDRRLREAQIKIAGMSEAEQTAFIQVIFVGENVKMYGKLYANKTYSTLSGENKFMMIRHVAEQLKTCEVEENRKARTTMWLAARK